MVFAFAGKRLMDIDSLYAEFPTCHQNQAKSVRKVSPRVTGRLDDNEM